ncbi:glycosyltransferase family 4 protein [Desulfovibrio mangrovi]|uniref:glycosyltransferase family 4 protein n=1 Tax=Desulfovibrio mangrovi TaxID=2976983 RepID=UPI0022467205|nr:glycosyltransferase family 4 protein [Desulfovibrio mangrovi]UZP67564.1 glycosyltransferase family 4 protein [Desulfovibrio mangrovi]
MPAPRSNEHIMIYHHRTQGVDAQGIHIHEMNKAFKDIGYSVHKVSLYDEEAVGSESRSGFLSRIVSALPGPVYELLELGYNIPGTLRLYLAVRKLRPRFIYERYSLYNLAGALVSRLTGTPLVLEVNAPLAYEKAKYGKLYCKRLAQRCETFAVNSAHTTIAVSEVLRGMLISEGGRADHITVMHNGVNPAEYPPAPAQSPSQAPDRLTLGFVGWFRDWHGLSELLITLDEQGAFRGNVHLMLIGDGPLRPRLEELIAGRGLTDHVTITGALGRQDLLRTLPKLDIALQPAAPPYASPMKLFEYMAAGKAIVAPAQANIREILTDGENGLLFTPGDWKNMVGRIMELIAEPALIRRIGDAARKDIEQNDRTWQGNAKRVEKLLKG